MARIHLQNQTEETIVATYSNSLICGRFINYNQNKYNVGHNNHKSIRCPFIKVQGRYRKECGSIIKGREVRLSISVPVCIN